ncbi:MAG: hypothetical protein WBM97_08950 [Sedimenticolaceae bacterium]
MLTEEKTDTGTRTTTEDLEGVERVATLEPDRRDQYVQYSHELPEDEAEASSRALVRFVPLAYGALLGGLADNLPLGLAAGVALSAAFDLFMGSNSILRSLSQSAYPYACPAIAAMARGLAGAVGRLGLKSPSAWREMRCKLSQF